MVCVKTRFCYFQKPKSTSSFMQCLFSKGQGKWYFKFNLCDICNYLNRVYQVNSLLKFNKNYLTHPENRPSGVYTFATWTKGWNISFSWFQIFSKMVFKRSVCSTVCALNRFGTIMKSCCLSYFSSERWTKLRNYGPRWVFFHVIFYTRWF